MSFVGLNSATTRIYFIGLPGVAINLCANDGGKYLVTMIEDGGVCPVWKVGLSPRTGKFSDISIWCFWWDHVVTIGCHNNLVMFGVATISSLQTCSFPNALISF